jgi:hypothetical protein
MRATPSLSLSAALNFTDPGTNNFTQTSPDITSSGLTDSESAFAVFGNFSSTWTNNTIVINYTLGGFVRMSAEL